MPDAIPAEACYLGWQESLTLLAMLVEPEIPGERGRLFRQRKHGTDPVAGHMRESRPRPRRKVRQNPGHHPGAPGFVMTRS